MRISYAWKTLLVTTLLQAAILRDAAAITCSDPDVLCTTQTSGGYQRVIENPGYDYVPSIMWDEGKYKMWWCSDGGTYGDKIYYAESSDLNIWTNKQVVFQGRDAANNFANCTSSSAFDCTHTCDPSVVKVRGKYYMYYSGFPVSGDPSIQNRQGVVSSSDGKTWNRDQNGGNPILVGKNPIQYVNGQWLTNYGAGHSSVVHLGNYYYMTYSDDSVSKGQYAMRSLDPTFQTSVEELTSTGWSPLPNGTPPARTYQYMTDVQNVDWAYIDSLKQFVIGITGHDDLPPPGSRATRRITFRFFDESLLVETHDKVYIQNEWLEGGGIARYANGHALHNRDCSKIHLHMLRPSDMEGTGTHYNDCWNNQFLIEGPPPSGPFIWRSCWEMGRVHWDLPTGLTSCPNVPLDYDGDSVSDPVVFRPSNARLYMRRSFAGNSSAARGTSTSIPISGDFDGDGTADQATVQINGTLLDWQIYCSSGICACPGAGCSTGVWSQPTWGYTSDEIAIADYDNDGKDDIAVFRASTGEWFIQKAVGGISVINFGVDANDRAAQGDFDGDGLLDVGVFRPIAAEYRYMRGSNQQTVTGSTGFGDSNCTPIIGDYDRDGKDDFAHYRANNTKFYVRLSTGLNNTWGSTYNVLLGASGDVPVRGDFNGDGWLDFTVFRRTGTDAGKWIHSYQQGFPTIGMAEIVYGIEDDKPPDQQ